MDGESNVSVCNIYGMSSRDEGMEHKMIEKIKSSTLKWFGYIYSVTEWNYRDCSWVR